MGRRKGRKTESVVIRVSKELKRILDELSKGEKSYREASEELAKIFRKWRKEMEDFKVI